MPHSSTTYRRFLIRRARLLTLVMLGCVMLAVVAGCKCYQIGNQGLFRGDIRTVHVPIIESDSNRRFLGQQLTEAVVKEIESGTPLTITDPAIANSILRARIVRDQKQVITENQFDEGRAVQVGWRVEVDWVDRNGVPLMPRGRVAIDHAVDFIPEGGQSLATAQHELIQRIAREIVGQMEMPW